MFKSKEIGKNEDGNPFYIVQIATILAKRWTMRPINRKRQTSIEMFVFILKPAIHVAGLSPEADVILSWKWELPAGVFLYINVRGSETVWGTVSA